MADNDLLTDDELSEDFKICRQEARLIVIVWLIQSGVMLGLFLLLGYNRVEDPAGYPLGLPGWYLFGGVIPAIVFLFVVIYIVRTRFREVGGK